MQSIIGLIDKKYMDDRNGLELTSEGKIIGGAGSINSDNQAILLSASSSNFLRPSHSKDIEVFNSTNSNNNGNGNTSTYATEHIPKSTKKSQYLKPPVSASVSASMSGRDSTSTRSHNKLLQSAKQSYKTHYTGLEVRLRLYAIRFSCIYVYV